MMSACFRRSSPLLGVLVEDPVQAADLLARQEARQRRTPVPLHPPGRVGFDVAAGDREIHDLPENVQGTVGAARRGPAVPIEPPPHMCRGDPVQRLRPEGGQDPSREEDMGALPGRWLVAIEMRLLPGSLDEVAE